MSRKWYFVAEPGSREDLAFLVGFGHAYVAAVARNLCATPPVFCRGSHAAALPVAVLNACVGYVQRDEWESCRRCIATLVDVAEDRVQPACCACLLETGDPWTGQVCRGLRGVPYVLHAVCQWSDTGRANRVCADSDSVVSRTNDCVPMSVQAFAARHRAEASSVDGYRTEDIGWLRDIGYMCGWVGATGKLPSASDTLSTGSRRLPLVPSVAARAPGRVHVVVGGGGGGGGDTDDSSARPGVLRPGHTRRGGMPGHTRRGGGQGGEPESD